MTKREIIYQVLEKLNIHSDDSKLSEELVSSLIDTKRALLLKQQYATKGWHMPSEVKQELSIAVELIDRVAGYADAGKVLATSISLPESIKIKGKEGPLLVRKTDNTEIPLTLVAIERVPYLFENRYTQHLTYCAVDHDGKLYLMSKDNKLRFLKSIKVTDIYEQPDVARQYESSIDLSLEVWDDNYPMEASMVDTVVELVTKDLARTLSLPADNVNDASDGRG